MDESLLSGNWRNAAIDRHVLEALRFAADLPCRRSNCGTVCLCGPCHARRAIYGCDPDSRPKHTKNFCASGKGSQQASQAVRPRQAGRGDGPGTAGALEEIFRRADERTRYGATLGVSDDVRLLIEIREIARRGLTDPS